MEIGFEKVGDVLVVKPIGRLDSNSAPGSEKAMLGRIEHGERRMVLDFSALDYISSAGLRVVLILARRLRKADGRLVLFGMNDHNRDVFAISGFLTLLTVLDTRDAAIDAARSG
jgi:stage II sporulation protein AA (anti-sigma F factor antagonist)